MNNFRIYKMFNFLDTLNSCETVSESLIIPETLDTVEVNKDGCKFYFSYNINRFCNKKRPWRGVFDLIRKVGHENKKKIKLTYCCPKESFFIENSNYSQM